MSKLSRHGIAYDLKISPYKLIMKYGNNHIEFTFSSQTYKDKFLDRCCENRDKLSESLTNRFGFEIYNELLFDLNLYLKLEKRGFLISCNGVACECVNNIILDGQTLIIKN